jgi:5-formyltetrahydrofolate cyclo-ligase
LENIRFTSKAALVTSTWGIQESASTDLIPTHELDMVLIPLLVFDARGNRVGYGKGFYDKLLSACRRDAQRIGISLFDGVERIDDVNSFDEPLHYCVTPDTVIRF